MDDGSCPFCTLAPERIVIETASALAIRDAFPVSAGHMLVLPRRHVRSFFDVSDEERASMLSLLDEAKALLDAQCHPDGYNIGINDGLAAGQTVQHMHIHLIPRYQADSADPRGGVRWVLPAKARYWP